MTGEYTETFAAFILSAQKQYETLCDRIRNGEVPANSAVKIEIEIPSGSVDAIRFDLLAESVSDG